MAGETSSKGSSKPAAALNQVRVTLREIEAVLDFPDPYAPVQFLAGRLRVPRWRIRQDQATIGPVQSPGERKREEQATRRAATPLAPPPGVYCKVTGTQNDRWWRTFARDRSTAIPAGKWVYVFQARTEHGDGARLVQELQFQEGGRFRRVDLSRHAGKDPRPVGSRDATTLLVDVEAVGAEGVARAYHLFYLAPYQLPWSEVEALQAEPEGRAALLWDEYCTDVYQGDDPSSARPLVELEGEGGSPPADGTLSFVVHLTDAIKEGLRRAQRYSADLDSFQQEEEQKRSDPVHQLAMRLHLFTLGGGGAADARKNVPKLDPYLEQAERWAMMDLDHHDEVAFDLVRWLLREEKRVPCAWVLQSGKYAYDPGPGSVPVQSCYRKAPPSPDRIIAGLFDEDRILFRRPKAGGGVRREAPWVGPLAQAANGYLDAPDETIEQVSLVLAAAYARILESAVGREALDEAFDVVRGARRSVADGGAALLFGAGPEAAGAAKGGNEEARAATSKPTKKAGKIVSTGTGVALAVYGKCFAERYKREALSEFATFVAARWGGRTLREVERIGSPEVLHAEKDKYKQARQALRGKSGRVREKLRKLDLEPGWAQDLKVLGEAGKLVELSVKLVDTYDLVVKVADAPTDGWAWADLGNGLVSDYKDATTFVKALPKVPTPTIYKSVATGAIKLNPLSMVTSVYDVVKGVRDIERAKDGGERTGAAIGTVGSAAALAGMLTVEVGVVCPVLALIGLGLQLAGKWYSDNMNDVATYLRNTRFGERSGVAGFIDEKFRDGCDTYWYRGSLSALAKDVSAQHRALTELMFNFTPKLALTHEGGSTFVGVEVVLSYSSQLANLARWELESSFARDDGAGAQNPLAPAELFDGAHSKSRFIPLFPLAQTSIAAPGWRPPTTLGWVQGKIVLHPFGDGGPVVTRTFQEHTANLFREQARAEGAAGR